jgi:hypothetical protein
MDEATLWRLGIAVFGLLGTIAVTLGGIMIRRLFKSIDLLFEKLDNQQKVINTLKLVAVRHDPDSTVLFDALTRNGNGGRG